MKNKIPAVACRSLEVAYGRVTALKGIDVDVPAGQLTAVIGPNGAGKTTLLRTICGLERPVGGELLLNGEPVGSTSPEEMLSRGVSLVPEGRHVFPHLSVRDNLVLGAFAIRRSRATVNARMELTFEWFPVLRDYLERPAGTLSGGEQQMLAVARALMSQPSVLCLDEPSLGLAPKLVKHMLAMLGAMRDRGATILLVEQFAFLALQSADRAYLLENGAVVRSGTGADLLADDLVRESYLGIRVREAG
jgi:ABC-type branched-subunit amino acid transport system ATPase component